MKNPYLVRMDAPEDCFEHTSNGGLCHDVYFYPVDAVQKDEMDCMGFASPDTKDVEYHEHRRGCETFFISSGQMDCCVLGRRFLMGPGDLLHIQPYMGHAFKPAAPDTKMRILFQSIDMQNTTKARQHMQSHFPGAFESPDMKKILDRHYGKVPRSFPAAGYVPPEQVPELRRDGKGLLEHTYGKATLRLKVGRWETHGEKEIWEYCLRKGVYAEWGSLRPEWHMFYVTGGKIAFKVWESRDKVVEFTAEGQNLVRIPPFFPFRFEVLEESRMLDLDCGVLLQDLIEELNALKVRAPEKLKDKPFMTELYESYNFYYTDVGGLL